jgi:hypothetical protein
VRLTVCPVTTNTVGVSSCPSPDEVEGVVGDDDPHAALANAIAAIAAIADLTITDLTIADFPIPDFPICIASYQIRTSNSQRTS